MSFKVRQVDLPTAVFVSRVMSGLRFPRIVLGLLIFCLSQQSLSQVSWSPGIEYTNQPALSIIRVHNPDPLNPSAYDQGYTGLGVRVGIIDSGINPDHVEFSGAIVAGMNASFHQIWSGVTDFSGNLYDSTDNEGDGHGTHVASIAAARLDGVERDDNMQGVAYNASLVIAGWNSGDLNPDTTSAAQLNAAMDPQWSAAFDFMVAQGARVINNSWGDNSAGVDPEQESLIFLTTAPKTVEAMRRALAAGSVIVFANGNDRGSPGEGMHPGAPTAIPSYDPSIAAYGAWIAVTATGMDTTGSLESRMASYADYCGVAAAYCVAAPGGDDEEINGAKSGVRDSNNTYKVNDEYIGMVGTSMASPVVTGAVALVAEKYPWMSNRNLVSTILTTASQAHNEPSLIYGRGLLDVNRAINGPAIFEGTFEADLPANITAIFGNTISGDDGLIKRGDGVLRLMASNTFAGEVEIRGGVLQADSDTSLGSDQAQVSIFDGTLKLGDNFITAPDGLWHKPIGVGADGATIDTNGNDISFAAGLIDAVSSDGSLGTLSFIGAPMNIAADLLLNANWNADLTIAQGVSLSGRGAVLGDLTLAGMYRPGNSPGTVSSPGSMQLTPTAVLEIEIDGPGTADGAGNHDRLLFTSPNSQFGADGTLTVLLRGISAPANNDFSPGLGQGFEFVWASGGVTGTFASMDQPTAGLLPGTQMDLVYGNNTLTLYATPASYANLGAVSVSSNANREGLGQILQGIRPVAGVREADPVRKTLFDALAPQTAATLPIVLDQLAGVSYVQLIGLSQQNTAFLQAEMASAPNLDRWGQLALTGQTHTRSGNLAWGRVVGRQSTLRGDSLTGSTTDTLGGVVLGTQRQIRSDTTLGFSMGYASSSANLPSDIGSGSSQNLQLMTYGSVGLSDGYFVQGGLGIGGSMISATRSLSLVGANYNANINAANLAANMTFGQFVEQSGWRYEWGVGLNYLGVRTFGFTDSGGASAFSVASQVTNNTSFQPNMRFAAGVPFRLAQTDWQAIASADYAYELADNRAYLNTTILNENLRIQSSDIGRNRLTIGLALSANVGDSAVFSLSVNNQFASNWNALSGMASLNVRF